MKSYDHQLKIIERRRWQLWVIAFTLIILFSVTISALSYWSTVMPDFVTKMVNFGTIRFSLIALSVALCAYIIEKELIFRRIAKKLINERVKIETLDHEVKQTEGLLEASKAVNSVMGVRESLNVILKSSLNIFKADHGSIMLYNELTGYLEIANYAGMKEKIVKEARVKPGEGVAGKVYTNGKPVIITGKPDSKKFVDVAVKQPPIESSMSVPLKTKDKILGVVCISVSRKSTIPFIKQDLKTLSIFAEQAASAIEKARLFEKTKMSESRLIQLNQQLKDKNISLKEYIASLKRANEELEKFNRLTINRELAMVRLKEKIKKLKSVK